MTQVRLHKYLADQGVASRRKCEEFIAKGMVKVNGKIVSEMGIKIDPEKDKVEVSPKLKMFKQSLVYIAMHKPVGYVTSVTGPEKPKVMELLFDIRERVFPVGRLDKETSGLLLFTNDGQFAYHMTHPKFQKEKEYEVTLFDEIPEGALRKLQDGMKIMGSKTSPCKIKRISGNCFRIILKEGKNRQIRRIVRKVGHEVKTLRRIRISGMWLRKLKPGEWKKLEKDDVKKAFNYPL